MPRPSSETLPSVPLRVHPEFRAWLIRFQARAQEIAGRPVTLSELTLAIARGNPDIDVELSSLAISKPETAA